MNKQQEIEQLAQAIYDSKIALDGSDYLFGIDGDDHFTKLAMHLVYGGYGNIEQAVCDFARKLQNTISDRLMKRFERYHDGYNDALVYCADEIHKLFEEFKNERTD